MKTYKGFDVALRCRGYQYEIGKEYEEEKAKACDCGFHACQNPLDVFKYYAPSSSRYCEVEQSGTLSTHNDDSKVASTKIKICTEIGIKGIIEAGVKFILEKSKLNDGKVSNTGYRSAATNTGDQSAATNTGNWSVATNTGYQSAATNTGDQSAATNTGDQSAATNTGYRSAATNTGNWSVATNTGNWSVATNTGDRSAATNTGNWSAATNTGNWSAATNTGDRSAASVEGIESVAISVGVGGKAKGAKGCFLVLAEWGQSAGAERHIKKVKAVKVDGKKIKEDTFYILKDGRFEEATD